MKPTRSRTVVVWKWNYCCMCLNTTFGFLLSSNGLFPKAQSTLAEQANTAVFREETMWSNGGHGLSMPETSPNQTGVLGCFSSSLISNIYFGVWTDNETRCYSKISFLFPWYILECSRYNTDTELVCCICIIEETRFIFIPGVMETIPAIPRKVRTSPASWDQKLIFRYQV